jgi:hypothetical protein
LRTDDNNNPTAFTTAVAQEAGLRIGVDYEQGTPFRAFGGSLNPSFCYTAKLLGDPIALTIQVIDKLGFYTEAGSQRWVYIAIPRFAWDCLLSTQSRDVIGFMYQREGGTTMRHLFPNYGQV